jgi:hypothetical protein
MMECSQKDDDEVFSRFDKQWEPTLSIGALLKGECLTNSPLFLRVEGAVPTRTQVHASLGKEQVR